MRERGRFEARCFTQGATNAGASGAAPTRGNMKHGVSCLLRVRRNVVKLPLSEQSRDNVDCVQPWPQSTASVSDDDFARTSRTNMRMLRATRRVAVPAASNIWGPATSRPGA
jgi:hypothetical protein